MKIRPRHIFQVLFVAYLAVVAWLCFGNFSSPPKISPYLFGIAIDKVIHFLMFLPYPFLFFMSFFRKGSHLQRDAGILCAALFTGVLMALATEYIQGLTVYRSKDMMDLAADVIALLTGTSLTYTVLSIVKS